MSDIPSQPERLPDDPGITVEAVDDDYVSIAAGNETLVVSRYNAFRLFGALSIVLQLPLPSRIGKAIKMG